MLYLYIKHFSLGQLRPTGIQHAQYEASRQQARILTPAIGITTIMIETGLYKTTPSINNYIFEWSYRIENFRRLNEAAQPFTKVLRALEGGINGPYVRNLAQLLMLFKSEFETRNAKLCIQDLSSGFVDLHRMSHLAIDSDGAQQIFVRCTGLITPELFLDC
jgi:hypothetical protein